MTTGSSVAEATFGKAPPVAAAVTESSLGRAAKHLTMQTGLTFPRSRHADLRRAMTIAWEEAGVSDIDSFLDDLERQPRLFERLISLITIGETYFFRHPQQLDVVSQAILPSLIAQRADDGLAAINVWCAGCSTGEEAYSLAVLISEALAARPGWEFRVAATDIDREALKQAKAGSYGRWSFRADLGERASWFTEEGQRRRVEPSIRDHVTFSADNLSLEDAGPPAGLRGPADMIVCRNVTMYLSEEARRRVAARFLRALAPGGWLLLAPVELSASIYAAFETVVLDGLTFYRRPLRQAPNGFDLDGARTQPAPVTVTPLCRGRADRPPRPSSARPSKPPSLRVPTRDPAARMATAHGLADRGMLDEARREAQLVVREDPRSVRGYLLLASIADAKDDLTAAAAALRRAVYLDRADATAQFRLGLLEWRIGRKRQARARLTTALALVAERHEDEPLDAGSDLTVGRLRSTAALLSDG